jgi:hypothetical protein
VTTSSWRGSLAALAGVAALAPISTGFTGCGHSSPVDRDAYVRANERLFAQLPSVPGARSLDEISTSYREEDSGPVTGYSTRFELALPSRATPENVRAFFTTRLRPRWRLVENLRGQVLNFRRGDGFVSINLSNARLHRLEIAVDHALDGKR